MGEVPVIELSSAAEVRAYNRIQLQRRQINADAVALKTAQSEIIRLRLEFRVELQQKDNEIDTLRAEIARLNDLQVSLMEELDVLRTAQLAPKPQLFMGDIILAVSKHFDVSINNILSRRRDNDSVNARQISMWMIQTITQKSMAEIGRKMHRDHTCVMHNIGKIEKRCQRVASFRTEMMQLKAKIERDLEACTLKEDVDPKTRAIEASV